MHELPVAVQASYVSRAPMNKRLVTPAQSDPPVPSCAVCGQAQMHLTIDTARPLSDLVTQVRPSFGCSLILIVHRRAYSGRGSIATPGYDADQLAADGWHNLHRPIW